MYQIRKSRIEIKADLIAHTNACKVARLVTNDWHNTTVDITNNRNDESNDNGTNINLAKFEIYTKILLIDSVRKTHCRWAVDNYTNSSKIEVITILITNFKSEISINKNDFIPYNIAILLKLMV